MMKRRHLKGSSGLKGVFLTLAAFGGLTYVMNRAIPKIADDYPFSFIWDGKNHGNLTPGRKNFKRVKTAKDLIRSQASHYMTWSGRIIGESMNQAILMKDDKKSFDVMNAGVSILWIVLVMRGGLGEKTGRPSARLAALMAAGYFLSIPHLSATSLWITGTMNYSWPGIFQYAYLLPYAFRYRDPGYDQNRFLMPILGLLAGWSNEAGGGTALALSVASAIRSYKRREDVGWMMSGIIGAFAGYALLMLAPGNFRRIKLEEEFSDVIPDDLSDPGIVPMEYNYTPVMFRHHFKNGFMSTMKSILPMQLPVLFYFIKNAAKTPDVTKYVLLFEGAAVFVPSVLMLSPQFPVRAAFLSGPLAMTAAAAAFENTVTEGPDHGLRHVKRLTYGALGAAAILKYAAALIVDADIGRQTGEQMEIIRNAAETETAYIPDVMISPFWLKIAGDRTIDEYIKWYIGYDEDPDCPYNRSVAAYYGAGEVICETPADHPYDKKDKESLREQVLRPVRSLMEFIRILPGDAHVD